MTGRRTHGLSRAGSKLYRTWINIRIRCNNPRNPAYPRYGGRGIHVCAQWDTFEAFAADMGEPPTSQHTIERRDNDKGYHPSNCYWGTRTEQARNIPSHVKMDVGKAAQVRMLYSTRKFRQKDLAEQFNVSISTINHIICNRKWL